MGYIISFSLSIFVIILIHYWTKSNNSSLLSSIAVALLFHIYFYFDKYSDGIILICQLLGTSILAWVFAKSSDSIDDSTTAKVLLVQIGTSIALIPFIFGIHSDVFGDHDKQEGNGYNWFNLTDIIRFPVKQLLFDVNSRNVMLNSIVSLNADTPDPNTTYLVVLDNTRSGSEPPNIKDNEGYVSMKGYMQDQILSTLSKKDSVKLQNKIPNINELNQIVFLCLLDILVPFKNDPGRVSTNTHYIIYGGDKGKKTIKFFDSMNKRYNLPVVLYRLDSCYAQNQATKTSYASIFREVRQYISQKNLKKVKLILIGDFLHETENLRFTKFRNIRQELESDIFSGVTSVLRLISEARSKEYKQDEIDERVKMIDQIIRSHFHNAIEDKSVETLDLYREENYINPLTHLGFLSANTEYDTSSNSYPPISIYRPYNRLTKNNQSIINLKFKNNNGDIISDTTKIVLRISHQEGIIDKNLGCKMIGMQDKIENLYINKARTTIVGNAKRLTFSTYDADTYSKLKLEVSAPKSRSNTAYRLEFKERLSRTSAIILLFFYNLLYCASFTLTFIYIYQLVEKKTIGQEYMYFILIPLSVIFFTSIAQEIHLWELLNTTKDIIDLFVIALPFLFNAFLLNRGDYLSIISTNTNLTISSNNAINIVTTGISSSIPNNLPSGGTIDIKIEPKSQSAIKTKKYYWAIFLGYILLSMVAHLIIKRFEFL